MQIENEPVSFRIFRFEGKTGPCAQKNPILSNTAGGESGRLSRIGPRTFFSRPKLHSKTLLKSILNPFVINGYISKNYGHCQGCQIFLGT
jgi:hypothetical protein